MLVLGSFLDALDYHIGFKVQISHLLLFIIPKVVILNWIMESEQAINFMSISTPATSITRLF